VRLAYLGTVYPAYASLVAGRAAGMADRSFEAWLAELERDAFGWVGAWGPALAPLGWTTGETWLNLAPLQRAWARDHGSLAADVSLDDIALAQIERFRPDVLWYDHHGAVLLERIRERCAPLRACVGWIGSALHDSPLWRAYDLVLSCAPETVETLSRHGVRAAHLDHAFNERVLETLGPRSAMLDVSFVGQITELHAHRERLLDALLAEIEIAVFSPTAGASPPSAASLLARRLLYAGARGLRHLGASEDALRRLPLLGRAAGWPAAPRGALSARLRKALQPGRFGLELYRTLRDSRVTLDVHAASAGRYPSNMRLFEATGVGTCVLTDAAENLAELFEPDREVATFRDARGCRERIRSLLANDAEREAIARAGQARCLSAHTFRHRAPKLDALLRGALR
jgi:spore maturation protein CgeB